MSQTTLDILTQSEQVTGHELESLLENFHNGAERVANDPVECAEMYRFIQKINPEFVPDDYSDNPKANILANVVAGIYAPMLHCFTETILDNIEAGILPPVLVAPPRDAYPIVTSLRAQMDKRKKYYPIITPPVNRITAGIPNAQGLVKVTQDPLFMEMLGQQFGDYLSTGYVELETGIYGTTSLAMARALKSIGMVGNCVSIKFYGLGSNNSFVHALLSNNGEWNAQNCEASGFVNIEQIAALMVLLDSLEEYGMQNSHKSFPSLERAEKGIIQGVKFPVSPEESQIALATNMAIYRTAAKFDKSKSKQVTLNILNNIKDLTAVVKEKGWPLMLEKAIPPMSQPTAHFQEMMQANVFAYPNLKL